MEGNRGSMTLRQLNILITAACARQFDFVRSYDEHDNGCIEVVVGSLSHEDRDPIMLDPEGKVVTREL